MVSLILAHHNTGEWKAQNTEQLRSTRTRLIFAIQTSQR